MGSPSQPSRRRDLQPLHPYLSSGQWYLNLIIPQGGIADPIGIQESTNLSNWTDIANARSNTGGAIIQANRSSGLVITLTRPGESANFVRFKVVPLYGKLITVMI